MFPRNTFLPKRLSKHGQRRLMLWFVSTILLLAASYFFHDAVQHSSLFGLLFSGTWIATILVNTIFIDYLLRSKKTNERNVQYPY